MPRLLPVRLRRCGEERIRECAECDTNGVGSTIDPPINCGAALWTKMEPNYPALLAVANVDLAYSFGSGLGLLEIDTDAKGRAGAPLTFAAMTSDDEDRFAYGFHSQRAAATTSNPGHRSPSLTDRYKPTKPG